MGSRDRFQGRRCLVTGATSGLGQAIAQALIELGARVIGTGRSTSGLRNLQTAVEPKIATSGGDLIAVIADLTQADDRDRLMSQIDVAFDGALDLVFNVAGVGAYGRFESHEPSVLRHVFEVNFFALAEICRLSLPRLRRGRDPMLVNMGSIVSRRGLPGRSEYSASKFAVAGLTEALRAEWAIDGIRVLLVNPGFTATPFEKNLVVNTAIYQTPHLRSMTVEQVAQATLRAVSRRKNEVTLTRKGSMLLACNRLMPRFVDWGLGRWTRRLYGTQLKMSDAVSARPLQDRPEI